MRGVFILFTLSYALSRDQMTLHPLVESKNRSYDFWSRADDELSPSFFHRGRFRDFRNQVIENLTPRGPHLEINESDHDRNK